MTNKQTAIKRIVSLMLALVALVTAIPVLPAFATEVEIPKEDIARTSEYNVMAVDSEDESTFNGGWGITISSCPVYADRNCTTRIGSLFTREGFTILKEGYGYTYIEYSTSSGPKRGYLGNDSYASSDTAYASVGKITATCNVFYGTDESTFRKAGAVYTNETVAILAKNAYWAYIEYNTTAGRKRGYIYANCVSTYNTPVSGTWGTLYTLRTPSEYDVVGTQTVYAGPSENYAEVGSVSNETVVIRKFVTLSGDLDAWYVEYNTSSGKKSGFILTWQMDN